MEYLGTPYLTPVNFWVACVLGFGGLLNNRCRISAPIGFIGQTDVWDKRRSAVFSKGAEMSLLTGLVVYY
jgi:hypothetical protein